MTSASAIALAYPAAAAWVPDAGGACEASRPPLSTPHIHPPGVPSTHNAPGCPLDGPCNGLSNVRMMHPQAMGVAANENGTNWQGVPQVHRMNWQQGPHLHQAPCRTPLQLLGGHEPPTKSMWTAPMQTAGEPECASPCRPPPPFVEAQLAFASSTAPLATPLAMLETSARRTPAAAAPPSLASSVGPSPAAARPSPAAARPSPAPPGPLLPSPTLDMIAAQTWIYPTNLPLRPYQHSIARCALLHNTLVSLPTGMGKTLIASVVMYNLSRWFPSSRLAFLAPTKPLVHQQIRALRKCVGVQGNLCAELTGNQKSAERSRLWRSCRFFFLSPQESHALYFSAFLCPFFHLSHIFPLFITAMFFFFF